VGGITWSWQIYFYQIYASAIGYNEIEKGWLFALIRLINSILIVRIITIKHIITKKRVFLFFPLLILISSYPAVFENLILNTVMLFTMTLASTLRFILLDGYTNELFDSKLRATAMSALNLLVGIVYIILVSSYGPILDRFTAQYVLIFAGTLTLLFIFPRGLLLSRQVQ